jgi:hypothetical protein
MHSAFKQQDSMSEQATAITWEDDGTGPECSWLGSAIPIKHVSTMSICAERILSRLLDFFLSPMNLGGR